MSLNEYLRYIDYLDSLGFDKKLLDSFVSISINNKENINPVDYLDELEKTSKETSIKAFIMH